MARGEDLAIVITQSAACISKEIPVQKTRIMIVDDSRTFRRGMRALLDIQPDLTAQARRQVVLEMVIGPV